MPGTDNLAPLLRQELDELVSVIRTEHQAVGLAARNMLEHALRAGDALKAAKRRVAEGGWESWVRKRCDLSLRCAQVYMQLAAARPQIEAQAQHAAPHSLRAALKLIGPASETSSRSHSAVSKTKSNTASKTRSATSFDALGWWSGAGSKARQHFLNGVGSSALRTAIPANWDLEGRMQERAAAAERIRGLMGANKVDTDPEGASENTSDEQARLRHFEFQNIALRSEIEELKARVRDLEDRALRAVSLAKVVDEVEHRLPATLPKKHLAALKALRSALEGHHLGPTLNLNPVADGEVTKH